MEKIESEVINEQHTNEYNGYFHFYTLNKKTDKINFIGSKKLEDVQPFKESLKINENLDYYITKNSFKTVKKRTNENVLGLNNIVIDIDVHHSNDNKQKSTIEIITHSLINDKHSCNFTKIIQTGRGVQIHLLIEQTSYVLSWLYQIVAKEQCEKYDLIINEIKSIYNITEIIDIDISASVNISGLVRLENTFNSINKEMTRVAYNNNRVFQLNNLIDNQIETGQIKQSLSSSNFEKNLINSRIQYIYNDHKIIEGNRMKSLFLLYNNLVQIKDSDIAKKEVLKLNQTLQNPIKEKELNIMFNYIDKKGFLKFKQETFIDWLGGNQIETRASKRLKNRQAKKLRDKKMLAMLTDKTITYQQIAETLGISISTVKRYAKEQDQKRYK